MKNIFIAVAVVVVLGGGWWWYSAPQVVDTAMPVPGTTTTETGVVREFTVVGSKFKFDVSQMSVKRGETVRVTFMNEEGFHDWVLDEFNARTQQIGEGKTETIEFVADQVGTFEYYCSVGQHRQMGMKGTLTVTE